MRRLFVRHGRVVTEFSANNHRRRIGRGARFAQVAASGPTEIGLEPGGVDVQVSLAVVWELV